MTAMFYEIHKSISTVFPSLNPLALLDFPAEDVFDFIADTLEFFDNENENNNGDEEIIMENGKKIIRRRASDNWF